MSERWIADRMHNIDASGIRKVFDLAAPTDEDGPYTMMHVIRFHEEAGATQTPDHMEEYQNVAGSVAVPNGVRIDGWFSAEGTILGDGRTWHQVRFNTFPSKAAFMDVVMDPERLEAQKDHREVAIADTYALGIRPHINQIAESIAGGDASA